MFDYLLPLSEKEITEIWDNGTIVFDTNILLHLYRYDIDLRNKLLSIIKDPLITKRIWIPNKVFEEFLKNRITVIADQFDIEQKVKSEISKTIDALKSKISSSLAHAFHPYVNIKEISDALDTVSNEINTQIDTKRKAVYNFTFSDDNILPEILKLLAGKVESEIDDKTKDEIFTEGKQRFANKIPPGYKDDKKGEPDCYSDLLIWKSILTKASDNKDIIFIVDDQKEDWWRFEKGRKIGPRIELLKEFSKVSTKHIIFYESSRFFQYVDEFITRKNVLTSEENEQIEKSLLYNFFQFDDGENSRSQKMKRKKIIRHKPTKEEVIEWFNNNYDDPANGVPYMSSEGGYQYWNGGPYDAEEEIQEHFPFISEKVLQESLNEITAYGTEWVKKYQY